MSSDPGVSTAAFEGFRVLRPSNLLRILFSLIITFEIIFVGGIVAIYFIFVHGQNETDQQKKNAKWGRFVAMLLLWILFCFMVDGTPSGSDIRQVGKLQREALENTLTSNNRQLVSELGRIFDAWWTNQKLLQSINPKIDSKKYAEKVAATME